MARTAAAVDVQPIDRLEEKVRLLVNMVDALRAERSRALDEITRLERELDALRGRLDESSGAVAEIASLREERELIRTRVMQMIGQIDKLNL